MAREPIHGKAISSTQGPGRKIKWTDMEFLPGPMEDPMRVTMYKISSREMEFSSGLVVRAMMDNGKMVNNMDKEKLFIRMVIRMWVNGKMANESTTRLNNHM